MRKLIYISFAAVLLTAVILLTGGFLNVKEDDVKNENNAVVKKEPKTIVYMTKDISPEGLMSVYKALNKNLPGKVAVKISTGEPGGNHYLSPDLI